MRIIAGDFKGRRIDAVKGDHTRPTSDKMKETIFNVIGQFFDGGAALDLFAGSGNLGIEALSRGIDKTTFIDANNESVKTIKKNISTLNLNERAEVFRNDSIKAIKVMGKQRKKFDLIFLDPPYGKFSLTNIIKECLENELIATNGIIVCEYGVGDEVPKSNESFKILKQQEYGSIGLTILKNKEVNL